jgi:hypothetical protein
MTSYPPSSDPEGQGEQSAPANPPYPPYPPYPTTSESSGLVPPNAGQAEGVPSSAQQAGGMPAYPEQPGQMPTAYPYDPSSAGPAAEAPPSINRAVRLMWVGAGLSALGIVVSLLTRDDLRDNVRKALVENGDFTQSKLDTTYNSLLAAGIITGIIAIALWLWMAYANGKGRTWARIVATVLGGLDILLVLGALAQGEESALSVVFSAINAVLAIAIIVLLWSKQSSAYYRARSRRQFA